MTTETVTPETETPEVPAELLEELELTAEDIENARVGKYKNSMLKIWKESTLQTIESCDGPHTIAFITGVLQAYPFIPREKIDEFLELRKTLLIGGLSIIEDVVAEVGEWDKISEENIDDWERHREIYLKILIWWDHYFGDLELAWSTAGDYNPVAQAAIVDVAAYFTNPEFGRKATLKSLYGFETTEEDIELFEQFGKDYREVRGE